MKPNVSEIKARAGIRDVWAALGGGPLRRNRGQAFWRDGDGLSVSIDSAKGLWHDFVTGDGGDVIGLVETARSCDFREATRWLADFTGVSESHDDGMIDTDWSTDLMWANWWSISATMLAEEALAESAYNDPQRPELTGLLKTIRLSDAALVGEYRAWRHRKPEWTTAMARAGRDSDARTQERVANWIRRAYGPATS